MGKHKRFEAAFLMPPLSLSLSLMYCMALGVEFSLNWSACPTSIFTMKKKHTFFEKVITKMTEQLFTIQSSPNRDSIWTFSRVLVRQKQPDFSSYFPSVCCVSFAELVISQYESTAKGSWKRLCQLLATVSKTRLLLQNVQNCTK